MTAVTAGRVNVPLWQQLQWVARLLAQVAAGQSTQTLLGEVPSGLRPGVQALLFQVLRQWGRAQVLRQRLEIGQALDAEAIGGGDQAPLPPIPQDERKGPAQFFGETGTEPLVQSRQKSRRVRSVARGGFCGRQGPQFVRIVQLGVAGDQDPVRR